MRCRQCGRRFVPNPRVAGRQVTCGAPACKRRQHAESCRRWREQNRDITSRHYEDAVKPFRELRHTYQREWRFLRSLREIRDSIVHVLRDIARPLGILIVRGQRILVVRQKRPLKARKGGQDLFLEALRIAERISSLMAELAALAQ